jgi:selenide,water dikinase
LVGNDSADDASVYKVNDQLAVITTVDFFTPIVDDPYIYGQIAAANSISDVFAMGGTPIQALNVLGFHQGKVSTETVAKILQGGMDKALEVNCVVAGGHSIQDQEVKYGLAVTGIVHPDKIWRNNTLQKGDVLVLTKPIGTGVVTTHRMHGKATPKDEEEVVASMRVINALPVQVCQENDLIVHACTDVTGFGLAGHIGEMLNGNPDLSVRLQLNAIPRFEAFERIHEDHSSWPGGLHGNILHLKDEIFTREEDAMNPKYCVLFDPQTNGGLIFSMPRAEALKMQEALSKTSYPYRAEIIGEVIEREEKMFILEE